MAICGQQHESASTFIREMFETARCDDVLDFSKERSEYSAFISRGDDCNKMAMCRILTYKETAEDEKRAAQARQHLSGLHRAKLRSGLSFIDWLQT
jgi:hypothetical protein